MSTRIGWPLVSKKISSWVRPGVCEVRASALRPVSALIRLDLPTFERPANAISAPIMAGSAATEPAAKLKRQSAANSRRPASISSAVKSGAAIAGTSRLLFLAHDLFRKPVATFRDHALGLLLGEGGFQVIE